MHLPRVLRSFVPIARSTRKSLVTSRRSRCRTSLEELEVRELLAIITVTSLADDLTVNSQITLREALMAANGNVSVDGSPAGSPGLDTIRFQPGLVGTIALTQGQLTISEPLDLVGNGAPNTIVDARGNSRVFQIPNGPPLDVKLDGLTITGGNLDNRGAGIAWFASGQLNIVNSVVTGNTNTGVSRGGGGIFIRDGVLLVQNSTVSVNSTTADSSPGGGIDSTFASVDVFNSTISGNSTFGLGSNGAGIFSEFGNIRLLNATVVENVASDSNAAGGGVFSGNGSLLIDNSIIAINADGGFVAPNIRPGDSPGVFSVRNSLIGDNTGTGLAQAPIGSPDPDGNLIGGPFGSGFIDPLLGPLALSGGFTETHGFISGSPAHNAVKPQLLLTPLTAGSVTAATDFFSVQGLIDNSALTAIPTIDTYTGVTQVATFSDTAWVTEGFGSDYYASGGPTPVLTFTLDDFYLLNDIVLWGYFAFGDNNNEAQAFTIDFSLDGGSTFGNSIDVTHVRTGTMQETIPFPSSVLANAVRLTITDNHFGTAGAMGGDRVGLGEVKFIGSPLLPGLTTDQRGGPFLRDFGPARDMGAYELQSLNLVVNTAIDELDPLFAADDLSLREAAAIANSNPERDQILFDPRLNGQTVVLTGGQITFTDSVAVLGPSAELLTLSANNASRHFEFATPFPGDHLVAGLTFIEGNSGGAGGSAISMFDGDDFLAIDSCVFQGNAGDGAIAVAFGQVHIANTSVINNSGAFGAGLLFQNVVGTLTNVTVSGNAASVVGGGIRSLAAGTAAINQLTIINSTIAGNSAPDGSGVHNASFSGGLASTVTLQNSIFSGNTGSANFSNSASSGSATLDSRGRNISSDGSGNLSGTGDLPNTNPLLGALRLNGGSVPTHALLPDSPAIDAGDFNLARAPGPDGLPNTADDVPLFSDARGTPIPRRFGANVDIGAYEHIGSLVVTTATDGRDPFFDPADLSLREALDIANANLAPNANAALNPDSISLNLMLVNQTTVLTLGPLLVTDSVFVTGLGAAASIISGNALGSVFVIDQPARGIDVTLSGMTMTQGVAGIGGAVVNFDETVRLNGVRITGNQAFNFGGGIFNGPGGLLVIDDSEIEGNFALNGFGQLGSIILGGGGILNLGTLVMDSSTVINNAAFRGGGIQNYSDGGLATALISNSTIENNSALSSAHPSSGVGGGIDNVGELNGAQMNIQNSTISDNSGEVVGGINAFGSNSIVFLGSSTVSGNIGDLAGGIRNEIGGQVELQNTLIGDNVSFMGAQDVSGVFSSLGFNLIESPAGGAGFIMTDILNVDANLSPLAFNGGPSRTLAPRPGSPAIDNGNADLSESTLDQRGLTRVVGPDRDIGAVEFQGVSLTAFASPATAVAGLPLTYTFNLTNSDPFVSLENVVVTSVLPSGVTPTSIPANCVLSELVLTCDFGILAGGGTRNRDIIVQVQPSVPAGEALPFIAEVFSGAVLLARAGAAATASSPADLAIAVSATPAMPPAGSAVTYAVTVTNLGPGDATSVVVTDTLPTGVTFVPPGGSSAGCSAEGQIVTCSIGTLASSAMATISIVGQVAASTANGATLSNTLSVAGAQSDPVTANNSTSTESSVVRVADLAITITDIPDPAFAGANLIYRVRVDNLGPSDASNVVVFDTLSGGVFVGGLGAGCTAVGDLVTCTIDAIPAQSFAERLINVAIPPSIASSTILNTMATADGTETDPVSSNDTATDQTLVLRVADLAVGVAAPNTVIAGTNLVQILTITNNGQGNASGVTVDSELPVDVTFDAVASNPGCTAAGQLVRCDIGELPPNTSAMRTIAGIVAASTADGTTLGIVVTVSSTTQDPVPSNNVATPMTIAFREPDLAIRVSDDPDPVFAGSRVNYTVTVDNNGPSVASGVTVSDILPAGVVFQASGSSPTCLMVALQVTCAVGTLQPSTSATITIVGNVPAGAANGDITNTATVAGNEPDPQSGNNSINTTTTVARSSDLAIDVTAPSFVDAGTTAVYGIVVTNLGPSTANDVIVTTELPNGVVFAQSGGLCLADARIVTCALGQLTPEASISLPIAVRVASGAGVGTSVILSFGVAAAEPDDAVLDNNSETVTTRVTRQADLAITQFKGSPDQVIAGSPLRYTLNVANTGPSDASGVTITVTLPDGLAFQATESDAQCTAAGATVNCLVGDLAASANATRLIVTNSDGFLTHGATLTSTATVAGNEPDGDANNSATATTGVLGLVAIDVLAFTGELSTVSLSYRVARNIIPDPFEIAFFRSNDARLDASDVEVGSRVTVSGAEDRSIGVHTVSGLDLANLRRALSDIAVPFVLAVIDPDLRLRESDRSDDSAIFVGVALDAELSILAIRGRDDTDRIDDNPSDMVEVITMPGGPMTIVFNAFPFSVPEASVSMLFLLGNGGNDGLLTIGTPPIHALGGGGDDTLVGGSQDDMLRGQAGDDVLTGAGGDDSIDGGDGTDLLVEVGGNLTLTDTSLIGNGTDVLASIERAFLFGGPDGDVIDASAFTGDVTVDGGGGPDTTMGGDGDDMFINTPDDDFFNGGDGVDTVMAVGDTDFLLSDTLLVGNGTDSFSGIEQFILEGGAGNNRLDASGFTLGSVTLLGGDGSDTVLGGSQPDALMGGDGNDELMGGLGDDELDCGGGDADMIVEAGNADFVLTDTSLSGLGDDALFDCEEAMLALTDPVGGSPAARGGAPGGPAPAGRNINASGFGGKTVLVGNSESNRMIGGVGAAVIQGNGGDDTIGGGGSDDTQSGGDGDDVFLNSLGNDSFNGELGNDLLDLSTASNGVTVDLTLGTLNGQGIDTTVGIERVIGSPFADVITGDANVNQLTGGEGDDTIAGRGGDDVIDGGPGNDRLVGNGGADSMLGGGGNDNMKGSGGDDTMRGNRGNDTIRGSGGNDRLFGNGGDDLLDPSTGSNMQTGGGGNDTCAPSDANNTAESCEFFSAGAVGARTSFARTAARSSVRSEADLPIGTTALDAWLRDFDERWAAVRSTRLETIDHRD